MPLDLDALADLIADTVRAETEPLKKRIANLEAREPLRGERGEPGEPGRDGQDADNEAIAAKLLPEIERVVAEHMPEPVPGPAGERGEPGERGEKGDPGRDATPADVVPLVLAEIPPPEKGEKGDPGPQGERGERGEKGADGINMAGGFVDQRGHLMLTRSNGDIQDAGIVKGADGKDGKDGAPGKDGADGLGFDDMEEFVEDDGRTIVRRYRRGEKVKEFRHSIPVVLDRGIYKEGIAYVAGDGVTYGGSFFIAQRDTGAKPGADDDWRLAVKRGRDGKAVDNEQVAKAVIPMLAPHVEKAIRKGIAEAKGRKDG